VPGISKVPGIFDKRAFSMITIKFFTTLRLYLKLGELHLDSIQESPIRGILKNIEDLVVEKTSKRFLFKLLDEDEKIKRGTLILINGKNVLDTDGLDAIVRDGDTVALFPPGGGG
jgi:molybdopterin synthase sulfur carrier subunit